MSYLARLLTTEAFKQAKREQRPIQRQDSSSGDQVPEGEERHLRPEDLLIIPHTSLGGE